MKAGRTYVIGVGANLGSRVATIRAALAMLAQDAATAPVAVSPVYASEAVGPPGPTYLNLALRLESPLAPDALWTRLARVETELGRVRRERWASRTLDLDVLWSDAAVEHTQLHVPHPELEHRWFALAPLLDVVPDANPRYHDVLAALGGAPVPGRPLGSLTDTELASDGDTLHVRCDADDPADALAGALTAFGGACASDPPTGPLELRMLETTAAEGDEMPAFARAVAALVNRGEHPRQVTLCALGPTAASGRALVERGRPAQTWSLARAAAERTARGHRVGLAFSRRITEG